MKKSFILHIDSLGILDELTDEQAGQLFKEIYHYHNPKKPRETQITQLVNLAFYPFKSQFERDFQTYGNVVERNKINGEKGGRPKNKNPKKPRKADSDNDSDSDSENDNDSKKENENNVFDIFWDLYDYKKGDKDKIKKKFNSMTKEVQQQIISYLPDYVKSTPDKQFRKHPETFLNNKSWLDELKVIEPIKTENKKYVSFLSPEDKEW